jgi:hypothetical protein
MKEIEKVFLIEKLWFSKVAQQQILSNLFSLPEPHIAIYLKSNFHCVQKFSFSCGCHGKFSHFPNPLCLFDLEDLRFTGTFPLSCARSTEFTLKTP